MSERNREEPPGGVDAVAWVRRANGCWIVHGSLSRDAAAYLDHLAQTDPPRLLRSCEQAYRMVGQCEPTEDPKPWFYCGLFSLASVDEGRRFLANHWLVARTLAGSDSPLDNQPTPEAVSAATWQKIQQLRAALGRLVAEPDRPKPGRT